MKILYHNRFYKHNCVGVSDSQFLTSPDIKIYYISLTIVRHIYFSCHIMYYYVLLLFFVNILSLYIEMLFACVQILNVVCLCTDIMCCYFLKFLNKNIIPTFLGDVVVVIVIAQQLDLQLPMQSVPITIKVVSSNPVHGEVYLIQHYVIKFVSDLRQVGGFLQVLQFSPPIKLTAKI